MMKEYTTLIENQLLDLRGYNPTVENVIVHTTRYSELLRYFAYEPLSGWTRFNSEGRKLDCHYDIDVYASKYISPNGMTIQFNDISKYSLDLGENFIGLQW